MALKEGEVRHLNPEVLAYTNKADTEYTQKTSPPDPENYISCHFLFFSYLSGWVCLCVLQ